MTAPEDALELASKITRNDPEIASQLAILVEAIRDSATDSIDELRDKRRSEGTATK